MYVDCRWNYILFWKCWVFHYQGKSVLCQNYKCMTLKVCLIFWKGVLEYIPWVSLRRQVPEHVPALLLDVAPLTETKKDDYYLNRILFLTDILEYELEVAHIMDMGRTCACIYINKLYILIFIMSWQLLVLFQSFMIHKSYIWFDNVCMHYNT